MTSKKAREEKHMKLHEFYQEYANTPIADREKDIGGIRLMDIYWRLHGGQATKEEKKELLRLAEIYYHPNE